MRIIIYYNIIDITHKICIEKFTQPPKAKIC